MYVCMYVCMYLLVFIKKCIFAWKIFLKKYASIFIKKNLKQAHIRWLKIDLGSSCFETELV
jgi:hypothetical protein